MTSKERVVKAIGHEQPDRVPIQIHLTPEIAQKLKTHFQSEAILERLGVDFRKVDPRFIGPPRRVPEGCDSVDEWGVGYKNVDFGTGVYAEAHYLPFAHMTTVAEVEAYPWPEADWWDYSVLREQCEANARYAVCFGGAGIPDIVNGVSRGRGMETVLMDIMTEDPMGVAIIDRRCDILYEHCKRGLEAAQGKIDILCLGEDCGNQFGPMFPPEVFDRFFRPRLQRFYDLGHQYGCKVMMHSCGSTRLLQSRFIEMSLDVLDAVQPEPVGMNPEELKREFGDRLTYCGMISTQETLPFKSEQACRAEARHRIEVIGQGGGYIFAPAHNVQPDTPLVNVLAVYEEALGVERGALIFPNAPSR